jgi:hypothetical protein
LFNIKEGRSIANISRKENFYNPSQRTTENTEVWVLRQDTVKEMVRSHVADILGRENPDI